MEVEVLRMCCIWKLQWRIESPSFEAKSVEPEVIIKTGTKKEWPLEIWTWGETKEIKRDYWQSKGAYPLTSKSFLMWISNLVNLIITTK